MVKDGKGTTDHVHQKSAWFCHGDVVPEGVTTAAKIRNVDGVDFWSENKGHGRIAIVSLRDVRPRSKNHTAVQTRNEWRTAEGTKILDEARTIHLFDRGDARLLVLEIDLHASVCPITFGDTKEGSMGVRVHDQLAATVGKGTITNAEGKTGEKGVWGLPSAWCDYSGTVDGKAVGVAVLDDPKNPHRAHWHTRGYGLLAANPFGRARSGFPGQKGKTDLVKLARGEHLRLRYGILMHTGDVKTGKVAEHYDFFVSTGAEP
jgi:hypothetical protein